MRYELPTHYFDALEQRRKQISEVAWVSVAECRETLLNELVTSSKRFLAHLATGT